MTLENILPFKDCWPQSFMSIVQLIKICLYFMILKIILLFLYFFRKEILQMNRAMFDLTFVHPANQLLGNDIQNRLPLPFICITGLSMGFDLP